MPCPLVPVKEGVAVKQEAERKIAVVGSQKEYELSEQTLNFVAQQNNITPQTAQQLFSMGQEMCQNIDESTDINDLAKQVKQMMRKQMKKEQKKKK